MKNRGYAKFERERVDYGKCKVACIERCPVILGDKRAGVGKNVIVISLPTQHLGVLTNSRLNVSALQIELEFGNDTLGARERTNNNLNPHGWWGGP